jgi:hypothetical protein
MKQRFTYAGFPGCRAARHPGSHALDSAPFAHGPVSTTGSVTRNTGRSLAVHLGSRSHGVAAFPSNQHGGLPVTKREGIIGYNV